MRYRRGLNMKNIMLVFIGAVTLLCFSIAAIASEDFYVSIHYDEEVPAVEPVDVYYRVSNDADSRVEDLSFRVFIPDLDVYEVSPRFDVSRGDTVSGTMFFELPYDVQPGEYVVRFVVSNDDEKRTKHRFIFIE
jgi:hypothetical protein